MHADTDPKKPGHRRTGCLLLICNPAGEVLLVKPSYKEGWILAGGGAVPNEEPHKAAIREGREETGLVLNRVGPLLLTDYVHANPATGSTEGLNLVFDGGVLQAGTPITLPEAQGDDEPELTDYAWVAPGQLDQYCIPGQVRRITEALAALADPAKRGYRVEGQAV